MTTFISLWFSFILSQN